MRGGRGMRSGLQESLRAGETDNMNNPLFLHPLGARSIKTPRMQARESKSQRGSTRTSQWNSSSLSSGPNVGVPRLSLDRMHAQRKGQAPKSAAARYAMGEPFLCATPRDETEISEDGRDIYGATKRNGVLENGKIDLDGRAKGWYAGLPNTPAAGELNKDFQLARYGEYEILQSEGKETQPLRGISASGSKTVRESLSSGSMDSPKQLPSNQLSSEAGDGGGHGLPPLMLRSTPSSSFGIVVTPEGRSLRSAISKDGIHTPRTPLSSRRHFDGQMGSPPLGSMLSPFGSAASINSRDEILSPTGSQDAAPQGSFHHRHHHQHRHRTYMTRKPASKWKELKVPDFYLKTLEGCSKGHIPSVFFEREPALSTAGNVQVSPFHNKPLPTDPTHRSASKEYFAPKGLGDLHCSICCRSFLSQELLVQHRNSTMHQYKEAQLRGEAQRSPPPTIPVLNLLDCGEFDDAYHNLNSDSDTDEDVMKIVNTEIITDQDEEEYVSEQEKIMMAKLKSERSSFLKRTSSFREYVNEKSSKDREKAVAEEVKGLKRDKTRFFRFVREFQDRQVSDTVLEKDALTQLREDIEEATENGHAIRADKLKRTYEMKKDERLRETKAAISHDDEEAERAAKEKAKLAVMIDARVMYLSKCKQLNILPKASIVTRKRAKGLDLKHYGAGDASMQAIAPSIRSMNHLRYVSLCDNRMEQTGSSEILEALRDNEDVETLDLSRNKMGRMGMTALGRVVPTLLSLQFLDISQNKLSDNDIVVFMRHIPEALALGSLNLSNNNIASRGAVAFGNAMNHCLKLTSIDLSWNAIRGNGVSVIGEALCTNTTLTDLNLAWNGLGGSKHFDVWANAFDMNTVLKSLDLTHNGLDERNCLIICENIKRNETIIKLMLNNNPLGPVGAKLVFKLMDTFGDDRSLTFEQCNFEAKAKMCEFNPSQCTGDSFALDLSDPYDRSVALALVRIAGKNIVDQWRNPKLDKSSVDVEKFMDRGDLVPREGLLELTYVQFQRKATKENVMTTSTFKKLTSMVSAPDRSEVDRLAQVQMLAEEIDLTSSQLASILEEAKPSSRGKITLILNLFSRIVDREQFFEVEEQLNREELARLRIELGPMWSYSDQNPTGHYKLNLSLPFDKELASKVLLVNNYERQLRKDNGLADTSDDGHYMNFRNETLNGVGFRWTGTWRVPETGILEFDYVSTERPMYDAVPLKEEYMYELLADLDDPSITDSEKLENILRLYTSDEYFTSEQVVKIVRQFREPLARVNAVVMCHRRIIDLENFLKMMMQELRSLANPEKYPPGAAQEFDEDTVPSAADDLEINEVLSRLGWLNCWNPLDADVMYRLELENQDQNIVAQCLVDLAVKEPGENWMGEHWDGKEFELPSTWIKEVPKRGFLEVHYHTDHISEDTLKSRIKRGDNFEVRVKWFKRTLCYIEGMVIHDDAYAGIRREDMPYHRNWSIMKHMPMHMVVEDAVRADHIYEHEQNIRWLQRRGYNPVQEGASAAKSAEDGIMMQCLRTGTILSMDKMLLRESEKAIAQGKHPPPKPQVILPTLTEGEEDDGRNDCVSRVTSIGDSETRPATPEVAGEARDPQEKGDRPEAFTKFNE